jgi:hypothetical protein
MHGDGTLANAGVRSASSARRSSAHLAWLPSDLSAAAEYPQDVRLAFETDRVVVISAFEQRGDALAMGMMDHITVFFDEAEAKRLVHGAGSPR